MSRLSPFLIVCLLSILSIGCSGDGKYPVSGTVTWDGEPIPADHNGHVTFMPVDASLTPDSGPIGADGTFNFRASPGEKKVEIMISRPKGEVIEAMGMSAQEQYIPRRYNEDTELRATIQKAKNPLTFDLLSQPAK